MKKEEITVNVKIVNVLCVVVSQCQIIREIYFKYCRKSKSKVTKVVVAIQIQILITITMKLKNKKKIEKRMKKMKNKH